MGTNLLFNNPTSLTIAKKLPMLRAKILLILGFMISNDCFAPDIETPRSFDTCSICLEGLQLDKIEPDKTETELEKEKSGKKEQHNSPITVLDCNHIFHSDCINKAIYEFHQLSCPLCRHEIIPDFWRLGLNGRVQYLRQRHPQSTRRASRCLYCVGGGALTIGAIILVINIVALTEALGRF